MVSMKVVNVPEETRQQFKILCIQQKTDMSRKIIELMKRAIAEELKK